MRTLLALAILAVLAVPAIAGDGPCSGGCPQSGSCADGGCGLAGFDCQNACPLAKHANTCRSLGSEAANVSAICRKDFADTVAANMQKI